MRAGLWAATVMVVLVAGGSAVVAAADKAPDAELAAEQSRLESGTDLSSRARRALFRARARQDEGLYDEAATIITQWLAGGSDRDHHLLRFNLAVSYLAVERPAEAVTNLERAVALAPGYGRAWLRLGEAAYELADYERAGEAFGRAYDLSPDAQPEILYYAGVSLLSGERPRRAVDLLTRLLDDHADVAVVDWYRALAAAASEAGQPDRAAPYLNRLLSAQPNETEVWDLAYRFYAGQSDYEQAASLLTVKDYLQTLSRDELVQLGDLYSVIGVPLQAARCYERAFAAATEPTPEEYRKLATAWLAANELTTARSVLTTALAAGPTTRLWGLKGDLEYTDEDYAAALAAFRAGTRLDTEFGRGYLMMGYCALEQGDESAAREYLVRATAFPGQAKAAQGLMRRLGSTTTSD